MSSSLLVKTPAATSASWDNVRKWLGAAATAERIKLFCQVMTGFELIALKKQHGIEWGNNQHEGRKSHDGISSCSEDWDAVLVRETEKSRSVAYRFMDMAKACSPRLKKLPDLLAFDPSAQSISALPEAQSQALQKAVAKLTDGLTQKEFGESLGLWKKPAGSGSKGRKPGEGGRKKLTLSEQAEAQKLLAVEDWRGMETAFTAYGAKFTLLPDDAVTAQIATMEKHLTARKAWLKQPLNQRDPKAVEALL